MATRWKAVIIRFVDVEFDRLKEYCGKYHIKISELIRNAVRHYMSNPDIINGVFKVNGSETEIKQMLSSLTEVVQKRLDSLEEKLSVYRQDDKLTDSVVKARIRECILKIKEKYKTEPITIDNLRVQLKKMDTSLTPYLFASATNGFSLLDEVLIELQGRELTRDFNGIIKFYGDLDACGKKN